MSHSVPTTNYGNNAARDEVHVCSCSARLPDPIQQGQLGIRYSLKWEKWDGFILPSGMLERVLNLPLLYSLRLKIMYIEVEPKLM